ncbi:MAG: NADH-quinone oxidoreductase subunit NuoE [Candidatus Mcinerneyibacterium aminivorans]|uniref:NADH-quinone oxidoreductase subunit NuoE n=1 Tax=Candidatus Mcinerneyibacterium aminivorans TaxID=2703815 RepID=A0A5D0MK32_9BACT|nr:MAG: NADH-quinone oxidoreductase subunit NuoE [Candidatus Mcinerneyibacterium aminivorans]
MEEAKVKIPDNEYYQKLEEYINEVKHMPGTLINVLHKAQGIFGYLPVEVQSFIADKLGVPYSKVYGVVTFYNFFSMEPRGKYVVNICMGTACYVKGADRVVEYFKQKLGIDEGETTEDGLFTLTSARCFGACGLAPVLMVNEDVYGHVDRDKVSEIIKKYKEKEKNE